MSYRLIEIDSDNLSSLLEFAELVYQNIDTDKYPEFRFSTDIDDAGKRKKFYKAFTLPSSFANHNIRQAFALVDDNGEYVIAAGVTRFENWPSWSVAWVLSPRNNFKFIACFRELMSQLACLHESIGFNEFFVTYPSSRESAYSKIMLPFREKYYTFVECTVPAKERSPYGFIYSLMGQTLHPHDMSLRRYILRRQNTDPKVLNTNSNSTQEKNELVD
jgi:hypothetical protein